MALNSLVSPAVKVLSMFIKRDTSWIRILLKVSGKSYVRQMGVTWKRARQASALVIISRFAGMGGSLQNVNMAREVRAVWLGAAKKSKWQKAIAFVITSRCVGMDDSPLSASVYTVGRCAMCPGVKSGTHLVASVRNIT